MEEIGRIVSGDPELSKLVRSATTTIGALLRFAGDGVGDEGPMDMEEEIRLVYDEVAKEISKRTDIDQSIRSAAHLIVSRRLGQASPSDV